MRVDLIGDMMDRIARCESFDAMEASMRWMRDRLGTCHMVYLWLNTGGLPVGGGTYDASWRNHYVEQEFARHDPVVRSALREPGTVIWSDLDWTGKGARALRNDAQEAGIGSVGLTMPLHGPRGQFAHITVTHEESADRFRQFTAELSQTLMLVGHAANQRAVELNRQIEAVTDLMPDAALSPRETDALSYLAVGLCRERTAERMGISPHTLRVYIESARTKLGAANTVNTVALAIHAGHVVI